jgi:hypothetical protein
VEQALVTLVEHLGSPPFFSGVCVAQSLVFCVVFVDHCLPFCLFLFVNSGHFTNFQVGGDNPKVEEQEFS